MAAGTSGQLWCHWAPTWVALLLLRLWPSSLGQRMGGGGGPSSCAATCGAGTTFIPSINECHSSCSEDNITGNLYFLGVHNDNHHNDAINHIAHHFHAVSSILNNHSDGLWDDILNGTLIETMDVDGQCDGAVAAPGFWNAKKTWGRPLHGVIGAGCSGSSAAIARIAALEHIPQISASATYPGLSDTVEFPYFYRTIAPDDESGTAGALRSLLRSFRWDRVSVLNTDTQYAHGLATAFSHLWVGHHPAAGGDSEWNGQLAHSQTITLTGENTNVRSVRRALAAIPTNDPLRNSRVIVLMAHSKHAWQILKAAKESNFQPDTIWIGTDGWIDTLPADLADAWAGFLGLAPYRNTDSKMAQYMKLLNRYEAANNMNLSTLPLPTFAAETVDATVAMAMAMHSLPPSQRRNGTRIKAAIRNVTFAGTSGLVQFNEHGDRKDPLYTVLNTGFGAAGKLEWRNVGSVGMNVSSVDVSRRQLCWPDIGCNARVSSDFVPSDKYPVPAELVESESDHTDLYMVFIFLLIVVGSAIFYIFYAKMKAMEEELDNEKNKLDTDLQDVHEQLERAKERQRQLLARRQVVQDVPRTWSKARETLVEVSPHERQYWDVTTKLQQDMPDAWPSRIWRIQNKPLWNFFNFHKKRLDETGGGHNYEKHVWHGTSSLDPAMIYDDTQDGFMMQFARQGLWGRGLYFAAKSSYSDNYSYTPDSATAPDRGAADSGDEREMFLTRLLVGNETLMDRDASPAKAQECQQLVVPPDDPDTGLKFNTVTGHTAGSQVWIVYENGRAYPDYLIRYYRGPRDKQRTPFGSHQEADLDLPPGWVQRQDPKSGRPYYVFTSVAGTQTSHWDRPSDMAIRNPLADTALHEWQFDDQGGWKPYDDPAQVLLEQAWQDKNTFAVNVTTAAWTYCVDLNSMMQTNVAHASRKQRRVRRLKLDNPTTI
jgi:ABC-type branched-subunit amino acid transport system substrate-binding protein